MSAIFAWTRICYRHAFGVARWVGRTLTERRPASGIWGGLHCLPVFEDEAALLQALPPQAREGAAHGTGFVHVLTHKDLHLKPVTACLSENEQRGWVRQAEQAAEPGVSAWFLPAEWSVLGLPAPVRKLLEAD